MEHKSAGILNIATGTSISFYDAAKETLALLKSTAVIETTPRNNPIVHRYFDINACYQSFPTFQYTSFNAGIKKSLAIVSAVATA